jgi:hypothetical protein
MQRRKFIAGVGSLAAGAAAVTGTGAFTSVSASRGIAVDTSDDADAFLAIEAESGDNASEYVNTTTNGTVELDITNTNNSGYGGGGSGVNKNATTIFDDLLKITNQGTQPVIVGHEQPFNPQEGALYHEDESVTRVGSSAEYPSIGASPDNYGTNINTIKLKNLAVLSPGETLNSVGFFVTPEANASEDFIDSSITLVAGAEPADLPGSPAGGNNPLV